MLGDVWFFAANAQASPSSWHQVPAFLVGQIRTELLHRVQLRQSYLMPVFEPASGREIRVLVFPHLTPDWVLFETANPGSPPAE